MRTLLPLIVVSAVLLILLSLGVEWGVHLALPLAAFGTAGAILYHRPRSAAWRWAAIGSILWGVEETIWAIVRLNGIDDGRTIPFTDFFYFAGAGAWLVAMHLMPQRLRPATTLLAVLPPLALLVWLLFQDTTRTLILQFPIFDVALFLYTLPLLEGTFRGRASDARLLWSLGFLVRALAAASYAWLAPYNIDFNSYLMLWLFGYTFIALGVWLEQRDEDGGLWTTAYTLLGLEAVIGIVLYLMIDAEAARRPLLLVAMLLGYSLFGGVMLGIAADRRRRLRAERELKRWSELLERLISFSPGDAPPEQTLERLMFTINGLFPGLCGIEVHTGPYAGVQGDSNLRVGQTSGYAFPMVADGTEIGHLYFRRQPGNSSALNALAPLVASQVTQALSQAEWQEQAVTDPLTGLLNRRGFEARREALVADARHSGERITVIMLDLDHFKRVNDYYGHPTGDEALRALAAILRQHTRSRDLVIRWGGEEFVLVLYGSDLDGAHEITRRIRNQLRDRIIAPISWPLTVSAGIAGGEVPADAATLSTWIAAADQALLQAKIAGRDRIEVMVGKQATAGNPPVAGDGDLGQV